MGRKLTLISAPAGFGKTTLISNWIHDSWLTVDGPQAGATGEEKIANPKSSIQNRVAWLSLDEGDNDPVRFWTYVVAALQTVEADLGTTALGLLHPAEIGKAPTSQHHEVILTALLNEIAALPERLVLVLDDYHVIQNAAIDQALAFLLDYLPPQLHLVIATRADPPAPALAAPRPGKADRAARRRPALHPRRGHAFPGAYDGAEAS